MIRARVECRQDLIALLVAHPLNNAFGRALRDSAARVEVLGGFTPAEGHSYWAVNVTSRFGRTWHTRIIANGHTHSLQIVRADRVDWGDWDGPSQLIPGDDPTHYAGRADDRP